MVVDGERDGADGSGTALQARSSRVRSPVDTSGRAMTLRSTQPLSEMSTRNIF
jgi:hypothetical protein